LAKETASFENKGKGCGKESKEMTKRRQAVENMGVRKRRASEERGLRDFMCRVRN
jgi:hypothetical protein